MDKTFIKKIIYPFIIVIVFCYSLLAAFAQVQIQRLEIEPLNRAILYCSEIPKNFKTELSADKQKITLKFENARVLDSAREFHGKGIIQDIYVQSFKNNLEISIILKDKRGYTTIPMPYSRALAVEVFQWDKIDEGEDNYRSGLLAIEDNLIPTAKKYLLKSVSLTNTDAAGILGILNLQSGNIKEAIGDFTIALKSGTKIPDVFAASISNF